MTYGLSFVFVPDSDGSGKYVICLPHPNGTDLLSYWDNRNGKWVPIDSKYPPAYVRVNEE